jgi:hypothetical protein
MKILKNTQEYFKQLAKEENKEFLKSEESPVSEERTPYLVHCPSHGGVYLTEKGYTQQMLLPDSLWNCPHCGVWAIWDDDNYDEMMG